jgi:phosphatidylglycerol---prolipoprotein diacylglyceryl transferase
MMSVKQKTQIRKHPVEDATLRSGVIQLDAPARPSDSFTGLLQSATREILAVTYWFDPDPHSGPSPVTVRFSGRRVDVRGRLQAGDRFVQDEAIEAVVPGSGPISITARVRDIHPGSWVVTAHILEADSPACRQRKQEHATPAAGPHGPIARFWRRWAPSVRLSEPVRTRLAPFVRVPGILPGVWAAMVMLGIAIALIIQALLIAGAHLAVGPWWAVLLGAIVVGIVGAKVWYIVLYRREHLITGWCIQGFITSATLTAAILLVVFRIPAGVFLDVTTPGLLVAMAVGRVGCFFAGCCGGPPTASRFGVWSSDQRVGARRVPTQLMESVLAGILGLAVLVAILYRGPEGGAFFVAGLSAYTLVRQGILHLRAEPRRTRLAGPITAALAALLLIIAVVWLVW